MRLLLVVVAAFAALALGAGCAGDRDAASPRSTPPPPAAPSTPANGALLFVRPVGDGASRRYELLATGDRGAATTRFTSRLFPARELAVSPDGMTVAFTRPGRTGLGAWRLGTPHDLFLAPVSGGDPRRLERTSIDERGPRFSHDGRWIAFNRPNGIGSDKVALNEIDDPGYWDVLSHRGDELGGSWAPDGNRLLYSHGSFLNGDYELYVTDADTGEVTQVPDTSEYRGGVWTPTGEIVTTTTDESKRPDETNIWLLAGDGSEARLIAMTRGRPYHGLAAAPDGRAMAIGLDFVDVGVRIVTFELGEAPTELTVAMGVTGSEPLWSPDGSTIAFLRGSSVWLMDADGSNPRRVEGSDGTERLVAWLAEPAG